MSAVAISSIVTIGGFFMSVGVSAFISGMRWGEMRAAVTSIDSRLAKIEGMFVMVPVGNLNPSGAQQHPNV